MTLLALNRDPLKPFNENRSKQNSRQTQRAQPFEDQSPKKPTHGGADGNEHIKQLGIWLECISSNT